ncbi:response regulator transcription factor [Actinoplanes sp. TBRC 11911]|uniref:response regulator n=1 Tax=Actinoplanes sp. TBRC 11911 TaxID=2729386 RepID=UPI00145E82A9|nr:response regulator transcription factor [Actinoplanes sp. TBRC 11911]NMO57845.1 response regulator transcription factor [Actinoplanes sp. TBRC 11911]
MSDEPVRVVLADDDVLLREGVASLLERSGLTIAGQAGDAVELLKLTRAERPHLAVVDIRMPPDGALAGMEAAHTIRRELPGTGVLLLSAYVDVEHALSLLAAGGGVGYLLKTRITDVSDFLESVTRVARGGSVVDAGLVKQLVSATRREDPLAVLSERERDVLAQMAQGKSNAGVARQLWVTEGTVEKHVRSIMTKLRLPETGDDHRRVLAVLTFLNAR